MKTFLITLLFLSAPGVGFSQMNTYFLNDPVWTVRSVCGVSVNCIKTEFTYYYTKGDTSLNGFTYKKVYEKKQGSFGYGYTGGSGYPANCSGSYHSVDVDASYFLRSLNKKVFLRRPLDANEHLLYDFNLVVGDKLPSSFNYDTLGNLKVVAIDSIFTPYGYRHRFSLNDLSYLIEGIGHSHGLVEYLGPTMDCNFSLDCFSLNDTAWFPSVGPTCNIAVGIESVADSDLLKVSPNPFSDHTTIHFNVMLNGVQLNIYNQLGQTIQSMNDISGNSVTIERGSLNSGVYFYEVLQESRRLGKGKLIVTD